MTTVFESRATVGLRPARSAPRIPGPVDSTTVHYNGPAVRISASDSHERCRAFWRGVQKYHMETHGWADVAYTMAACPHGILMAGRGKGVRTAANGTRYGNDTSYAIFALVGEGERPTDAMLTAIKDGARALGKPLLKYHGQHKPTACAGRILNPWVAAGAPYPKTTPTTPDQEEEMKLKKGDSGPAVALMMRCLINESKLSNRGGPAGQGMPDSTKANGELDGIYGDEMVEAVKNYQRAAFQGNERLATGEVDGLTSSLLLRYEKPMTNQGA